MLCQRDAGPEKKMGFNMRMFDPAVFAPARVVNLYSVTAIQKPMPRSSVARTRRMALAAIALPELLSLLRSSVASFCSSAFAEGPSFRWRNVRICEDMLSVEM